MLSLEQEAELDALLEYESARETVRDFVSRVTPRYPAPQHVDPILRLFERAWYEPVRATISMPPRFAKTETCMNGLAHRLYYDPASYSAYLSAGANLAREKSKIVQRRFVEAGGHLMSGSKSVEHWNTAQGGGLWSGGAGTHIQGKPITGIAIIDDAVKGREAADSPLQREKVWDWFTNDVNSRLEPGASVIVVCTRWHDDDLIGRIHSKDYESEDYEEINLPAVVGPEGEAADERVLDESGNVLRGVFREDVRSLWPEQRSLEHLASKRLAGEWPWWSLYQGQPRPKGSAVFTNDPSRFSLKEFERVLGNGGFRFVIAVDPAGTASTRADHSVAAVGAARGYGDEMEVFWLKVIRGQWTIPELCRRLRALQSEYRVPLAIEAVGAFNAVPQMLAEADPSLTLLPVPLKGDKFSRSQPYAAAWNTGRIHVPYDAPWATDWISEHAGFTGVNDKNDDQVDAGAHGFTALLRTRAPRKFPQGTYTGPFG